MKSFTASGLHRACQCVYWLSDFAPDWKESTSLDASEGTVAHQDLAVMMRNRHVYETTSNGFKTFGLENFVGDGEYLIEKRLREDCSKEEPHPIEGVFHGQPDLVVLAVDKASVFDWKTGYSDTKCGGVSADSLQLKGYQYLVEKNYGVKTDAFVVHLFKDRDARVVQCGGGIGAIPPMIDAIKREAEGHTAPNPGGWCKYCPIVTECPARIFQTPAGMFAAWESSKTMAVELRKRLMSMAPVELGNGVLRNGNAGFRIYKGE